MLFNQVFQGSGTGAPGKTALMNAGHTDGETLPGALLALQSGSSSAPRSYALRLSAPVGFSAVNALVGKLTGQPSLTALSVRALDAAGVALNPSYTGSVSGLGSLELAAHF